MVYFNQFRTNYVNDDLINIIQSENLVFLNFQITNNQKQQIDIKFEECQQYYNLILFMQFLKPSKEYFQQQLKSNISNVLGVKIKGLKDLTKPSDIQTKCSKCQQIISTKYCLFCGQENKYDLFQSMYRNLRTQKQTFQDFHGVQELLLLCIDKSGSMRLSYPSTYKKYNKEYIKRKLGQHNFGIISKILKQEKDLINNFEHITMLLQLGQDINTIGKILQEQTLDTKTIPGQQKNQEPKEPEQEAIQYIERRDIIQNLVAQFIQYMKNKNPNVLVCVVFFSDDIEIPTFNFSTKITVSNIQNKTLEEMVQLGEQYSKQISIEPISTVGNKIINNIMETQLMGGTALTPTVAFCIGLAKGIKSKFNQVIIFTDGMSNTGFGAFEEQKDIPLAKQIYKRMAIDYAVKNSCIFNIIGFEDSLIGYQDVLDQFIKITNGVPMMIELQDTKLGQKCISNDIFLFLGKEMIEAFGGVSKKYFFDTKIAIMVNDKRIKLKCSENIQHNIIRKDDMSIALQFKLRTSRVSSDFIFTIEQGAKFQPKQEIKFTLIISYNKKNKKYFAINEAKIIISPGNAEQAEKSQVEIMTKEVKNKIQGTLQMIEQQTTQQYQAITKKLEKNPTIMEKIDPKLLEKFNVKMKKVQQFEQQGDKLTREKTKMKTRRTQTYKQREMDSDQDVGFM